MYIFIYPHIPQLACLHFKLFFFLKKFMLIRVALDYSFWLSFGNSTIYSSVAYG